MIDEIIIEQLVAGKTQKEIAALLQERAIQPNSLSSIEKRLKKLKEIYKANTMFHLGVILSRKTNRVKV